MTLSDQVLVVDDNELIRAMMTEAVRGAGCQSIPSSSATEAIGSLATLQPLAAFIDMHMPDCSGDECCKIIKSNEELADMPVLMMTSADSDEDAQRAFSAGADDYLPKPIQPNQVLSKIEAIREGLSRPVRPVKSTQTALKTVLVADDDGFFRSLVGRTLERAGYEVVCAETGLDALRVLNRHRPEVDLCVVDMVMPGLGGLELIRRLRGTPRWSDSPIMVISGSNHASGTVEDLRRLKVQHLIRKDALNLDDLLSRVNQELFKGPDSRAATRVRFYRTCEFREFRVTGDGEWLSGFIYSLSATGVAVRTLTGPLNGSLVELRFNLSPEARIAAHATVVWSNPFNPRDPHSFPYGIGLKFVDLSPRAQESIHTAMTEALMN